MPVATDAAALYPGEQRARNRRRARRIELIVGHAARLKHPQVPAMAALAVDLDEHLPARLIGVPVPFAAQLAQQRLGERCKQRGDGVQSPGERAHRQAQSLIGQILNQAVTRPPVQEFIQQHAHPHRDAEFTARDQSPRRCGRDDARHLLAMTGAPIPPPPDQAPIGPDLDFQHLAVVSTRKGTQRLTADRAHRRFELDILGAQRQLLRPRATMAGRSTLMSSSP